jgi:hypothetical protein
MPVLTKNLDLEKARARARSGALEGIFAGVPVMLKNLQQYKDANIDWGSRLFAQAIGKLGNLTKHSSPTCRRDGTSGDDYRRHHQLPRIRLDHPVPDGRVKCPDSFIQAISAASLTLRCLFPST